MASRARSAKPSLVGRSRGRGAEVSLASRHLGTWGPDVLLGQHLDEVVARDVFVEVDPAGVGLDAFARPRWSLSAGTTYSGAGPRRGRRSCESHRDVARAGEAAVHHRRITRAFAKSYGGLGGLSYSLVVSAGHLLFGRL